MGTIYNYFPSKEALVNQLYVELVGELGEATLGGYSYDAPLREQFFTLVRNKFNFCLKNPEAAQFLEQYGYSPILTSETQGLAWKVWQVPVHLMEQGRKQQILKDLPTQVLIILTSSFIYNLVREHYRGHVPLDAAMIDTIIAACWDAIKL